MPIVYIHGVAVRDEDYWPRLQALLRRYVCPIIADDPEHVPMFNAFWGNHAARFRYKRASLPKSPILRMGFGNQFVFVPSLLVDSTYTAACDVPADMPHSGEQPSRLLRAGATPNDGARALRLSDLTPDQLADLGVAIALRFEGLLVDESRVWAAAEAIAYDPATKGTLLALTDAGAELRWYAQAFQASYDRRDPESKALVSMGTGVREFEDALTEVLARAVRLPLFAVSRVLIEMRRPLNNSFSDFFGDVFVYLDERLDEIDEPGEIPRRVSASIRDAAEAQDRRGGEPIVVLTHSMGGQVFYDQLTYFLLRESGLERVQIAFWGAIASQVALFEELKLHLVSDEQYNSETGPAPFPGAGRLRHWWNVWDYNDILSYTARGIFAGVQDESYDTGGIVGLAHSDYFKRPSFFRRFAERLKSALPARGPST